MGWTLAIDYGTSNTAAAVALDGGAPRRCSSTACPGSASMVVLDADGELVVGRKAENLIAVRPEAVERAPKRRLGVVDAVVLGGREVEVAECVAAVLRPVVKEALRQAGQEAPDRVVLTHPAAWTSARTDPLRAAAARAGLHDVELLEEPVAAARHYAAARVAAGGYVAVYDLGGGTFDTVVLQRTRDGFVLAGKGGDQELGGEDFDERLGAHVAEPDRGDRGRALGPARSPAPKSRTAAALPRSVRRCGRQGSALRQHRLQRRHSEPRARRPRDARRA